MDHAADDAEDTLVVHFDKEKALRQDYDFQIIVPLTVEYHNLQSESTIRIEAKPTGNNATYTYMSFRGQFLTTVEDRHSSETFSKYYHQISPRKSNKVSVERSSWEEGFRPAIEFRPSKRNGNLSFNFLGIFSTMVQNKTAIFDENTGIQITVKEQHSQRPLKTLAEFNIQLDHDPEKDYTYSDKKLLDIYNQETHRLSGDGSSIHPKQLITVSLLEEALHDAVSEGFPNGIDVGYIGLDTGENLLSVLRYFNRASVTSKINNIYIFFERKWDEKFRLDIAPLINKDPIFSEKVRWIEVKSTEAEMCKVDFLISTYVAVWAMSDSSMLIGDQDNYFKDTFRWCKDTAMLLSVDPKEHEKIARSNRYAGRIDPTSYYKDAGFIKTDHFVIGSNQTCTYSVWTKGNWGKKTIDAQPEYSGLTAASRRENPKTC